MPDIFIHGEEVKKDGEGVVDPPKNSGQEKHSRNFHIFGSYFDNPSHIKFADQLEDEKVLLFLRAHFVTNVPWILKAFGLSLIPLFLLTIQSFGLINLDFFPSRYQTFIIIFYYLLIWAYMFTNYVTWFYNISLVTDKRIVDIDFSQIVFENVSATKLSQVEDVSYSQIGVIRSVFDYGNVLVQTAGTASEFMFQAVPHPERVIKVINQLIGEAKHA